MPGKASWVWEGDTSWYLGLGGMFRLRTEDSPWQWKVGPRTQRCGPEGCGFREASDAMCSPFWSGPDWNGCDRSVFVCVHL